VEAVFELLERKDKPSVQTGTVHFNGLRESIKFDSVSFQYELSEQVALQDLSIQIHKGNTTAIVGPSGAGKSTLIHLLLRFYEPCGGIIYVDDDPLEKLNLKSWRARLAVVRQEEYIFNTTVRQNIAYGRMDATDSEIISAAELALANQFIRDLPKGYDTILGDQGVHLSTGQKQRIALARAIVRDPEILLIDEAANALDSVSERQIQENLKNLPKKCTIITVAHRLSSIEQADHIVVLGAGKVAEQGNTRQLLKNRALFARLYALQSQSSESRPDHL
jgi:subfamily B ATP-binding cassette protein MsbA